jgi:hypothetical protein
MIEEGKMKWSSFGEEVALADQLDNSEARIC